MSAPRLILVDPGAEFCGAAMRAFEDLPNVQVVHGFFEQVPEFDCMVSPANSFGVMDGGVAKEEAARQMALAYRHYLDPPSRINWSYANDRQVAIGRGGDVQIGGAP